VGGTTSLCQIGDMTSGFPHAPLQYRLIEALYDEAMLLADEARTYFEEAENGDRNALEPLARVGFSCESLKLTTRLMHVIAWLLTQRAVVAGELGIDEARHPSRRLGDAPVTTPASLAALPSRANALIGASVALHRRVALLDTAQDSVLPMMSPALSMQARLAQAL